MIPSITAGPLIVFYKWSSFFKDRYHQILFNFLLDEGEYGNEKQSGAVGNLKTYAFADRCTLSILDMQEIYLHIDTDTWANHTKLLSAYLGA